MLIVALCSFSVIRRFFANNLEHLSQSVARLVKTQITANVLLYVSASKNWNESNGPSLALNMNQDGKILM